jgi:putative hydrolase of the HAD superfamily
MTVAAMTRPTAVLFDLDGTLTDRRRSMEAFAARFTDHFADALRPPGDGTELRRVVRDTLVTADGWGQAPRGEFFTRAAEQLPWARRTPPETVRAFWHKHFADCTQPAADLHDALRSIRALGIRLGVVSNGRGDMQREKLEVLGVHDALDCVVISGELGVRKPDPRIFRHVLRAMNIAPEACWFVGDHPVHDVAGARGAGMTAAWVDHGQPWPAGVSPATHRITRLAELVALIT